MPCHSQAIFSSVPAGACPALPAPPAMGDVLIDEFSQAGIYTNPWPLERADFNDDGLVNVEDLLTVLAIWT